MPPAPGLSGLLWAAERGNGRRGGDRGGVTGDIDDDARAAFSGRFDHHVSAEVSRPLLNPGEAQTAVCAG